jgi:ABC-2 type transport system permease protein
MRPLVALTAANLKSFFRDRTALFWTAAFPVLFVVLFGLIFQGGTASKVSLGWVDQDGSPASAALEQALAGSQAATLKPGTLDDRLAAMRQGQLDAVLVVPPGFGRAAAAVADGSPPAGPPFAVRLYVDPSQQTVSGRATALVEAALAAVNLGGRPPAVVAQAVPLQTETLNGISYFVPSLLGMALMQLGVYAAVPLVGNREKLILKRLAVTPLRRWQLLGANVLTRLVLGLGQAALITGVGMAAFGVKITGHPLAIAGLVVLGAVAFLALGYLLASFTPTEDAANAVASVVQFPLMFLSGTFFPIQFMPDALQAVARVLPLTYLSDALRQVMVGGSALAPLPLDLLFLTGWLVVCFAISARFFRWQ